MKNGSVQFWVIQRLYEQQVCMRVSAVTQVAVSMLSTAEFITQHSNLLEKWFSAFVPGHTTPL